MVHHQGDLLTTQESNQRSTPGQSSPEWVEGIEDIDPSTSSKDSDNMPTTTRLKYSRFREDGSQDVDDWFCEFKSTPLANQEEN